MQIPYLILGTALVTLGRRLYWLFVGVLGFLVGLLVAESIFRSAPPWLILLGALAVGAGGALLAIFVQRLGIAAAGFLAGAYLADALFRPLSLDLGPWGWAAFVFGGVIGALLMSAVFDWALIGLSSLTGSVLIVQSLELRLPWSGLLFFALLIVGLALQGRLLTGKRLKAGGG